MGAAAPTVFNVASPLVLEMGYVLFDGLNYVLLRCPHQLKWLSLLVIFQMFY